MTKTMKHLLIILALGLLGTGLYWIATSGHANFIPDTGTEQNTPDATVEPDRLAAETTTDPTTVHDDFPQEIARDTGINEAPGDMNISTLPSRLGDYEQVLRNIENAKNNTNASTPEHATTRSTVEPNAALQAYEATLRTLGN